MPMGWSEVVIKRPVVNVLSGVFLTIDTVDRMTFMAAITTPATHLH